MRRTVSVILTAALLVVLLLLIPSQHIVTGVESGSLFSGRETIRVWYTDEALTNFFSDTALQYGESQSSYRIEAVKKDPVEFLQQVNTASAADESFPDLYVVSNDLLEQAYLSGLAKRIDDPQYFSDTMYFPQTALNAVTYNGKTVAWPLYYETSALVYNTQYLQDMADALGISGLDAIPSTVVDIINLANSYEAPEQVQAVFKWDVNDIFFNYYFAGGYLNVGGECGDDKSQFDVYNGDVIRCLDVYQQLNQFFSIDTQTDDYSQIVDDFIDGKIVFTVATSELPGVIRERLAERGEDAESSFHYGVTTLPDITSELPTRAMSVTYCLAENGYGENPDGVRDFMHYLYQHMENFYDSTGKAPVALNVHASDPHMESFLASYKESVPLPKMRETSNFWVLLENTYAKIWNGADVGTSLRELYEQSMLQITGEEYTAEELASPDRIDISAQLEGMD